MREKGSWSDTTYRARATVARERKSVTFEGEDRAKQGKGLDPLVDPAQYNVVRMSNNLLVPDGDEFVLQFGTAMPVKTDLDTTGSMGGNVEVAFKALPKVQDLLVQGANAVLKRYHVQIQTCVVQDQGDQFPFQSTQFEPDNEVERQMGLLVPERRGGDSTEDYQLGLFAAGYLTKTSIVNYGLKGYYFIVGDEIGRDELDARGTLLRKVFGKEVMEKAFDSKKPQSLPTLEQIAKKVLEKWHVFFLQIGSQGSTTNWWSNLIGEDRVVKLSRTEDLAQVQACIIGLTEGVIKPKGIPEFLKAIKTDGAAIARITNDLAGIPVGMQTALPNFDKIPTPGSRFKNREDIWPIDASGKMPKKKPDGKKSASNIGL
ncbi:hypothetical protein HY967_03990 [Candidatus Jorgensenbacteria bacterium]|nr:hypothetical protein [Candidatus Jorgensenbacteria bacterium]